MNLEFNNNNIKTLKKSQIQFNEEKLKDENLEKELKEKLRNLIENN